MSNNYCPIHCSNSNELNGQELWDTLYDAKLFFVVSKSFSWNVEIIVHATAASSHIRFSNLSLYFMLYYFNDTILLWIKNCASRR